MHPYLIVIIGILIVLGLIIVLRINAFIALISAALVVSFLAPGPIEQKVSRVAVAFGENAGKIGLVIGFAAVIGEAMMLSGAADRIVHAFLRVLGAKRAPLALMSSGFLLSVPVFFDTVFYLLVPLAKSLYRTTRKNYLLYLCAIVAGGACTHTLVPPTPGPLAVAATLNISIGLMMVVGTMVAIPSAIAGLIVSAYMNRKITIANPPVFSEEESTEEAMAKRQAEIMRVPLVEALLPVLLPVLLISGDTIVDALKPAEGPSIWASIKPWTQLLGNPSLALLVSMAISTITWVRLKRPRAYEFTDSVERALLSAGLVILITAAGGAFGAMLKATNIATTIQESFGEGGATGLVSILLAFGLAALLKVAQGSSTTAMITVSAMMAAMGLTTEQLGYNPVYLATSIAGGSLIGSWMNDSGFWIFARMGGLTETEALKTWTPLLLVLGTVSLITTILLSIVMPLT
jgi:gluconate:H+ symporter, GntP family